MSDKLVSLNAVLALLNVTSQDEITDECYDRLYNAVANMDAAPQEMSAREYGRTLTKICVSHKGRCWKCELDGHSTGWRCMLPDSNTIPIVEKWAREHPEEVNDER